MNRRLLHVMFGENRSLYCLSNGPDKKESNNGIERCQLYYCLYYTSDWLKQQKLRKLHKAVYSLNNTEILCAEHVKL